MLHPEFLGRAGAHLGEDSGAGCTLLPCSTDRAASEATAALAHAGNWPRSERAAEASVFL